MAETGTTVPGTQERRSPDRLKMEQDLRVWEGWLKSLDSRVRSQLMTEEERNRLIALALVTKDRRKEEEQKKNERDPMTGLYRQEHFRPMLKEMIRAGKPFAVLFTDLDRFGEINKQYGQPAGDEVIIQTAIRITEQLREEGESGQREPDLPFRIGGDETAIILPGIDSSENLQKVAEKIRTSMQSAPFYIPLSDAQINLTVSIGGAIWNGENKEQFMSEVGRYLVDAKKQRDTMVIK